MVEKRCSTSRFAYFKLSTRFSSFSGVFEVCLKFIATYSNFIAR